MQPKVSQEILDDIRVAALHPPMPPHDNLWQVAINVNTGEGYNFSFANQGDAEKFFETLKPKVLRSPTDLIAAGPRMYSHEEVKSIVDAAVHPVVEEDLTPPSIWTRIRNNWKVATLAIGLVASLISSVVTLKVVLGPVKVPDIVITLPDGSVVPSGGVVETKYKVPVTNGLPD